MTSENLWDELQKYVKEGMVRAQSHPFYPYTIFNYTPKAQFTYRTPGDWPDAVKNARGLILQSEKHYTVARGFPKFHNIGEHSAEEEFWNNPFTATAKLDGSLIILFPKPINQYHTDMRMQAATRGSFTSEQALRANSILKNKYKEFSEKGIDFYWNKNHPYGVTLLFEVIYPENQIVVNYGGVEDLVLLAAVDNRTGQDVASKTWADIINVWPGQVVNKYDIRCKPHEVLDNIGLQNDGKAEGVVLRFDLGKSQYIRVKAKFSEYVRLHKIVTGLNKKTVWEYISEGESFEELLTSIPDELYTWLQDTIEEFTRQYKVLEQDASDCFDYIHLKMIQDGWGSSVPKYTSGPARAAFARLVQEFGSEYRAILFKMLDGQSYSHYIWKMLKPESVDSIITDE